MYIHFINHFINLVFLINSKKIKRVESRSLLLVYLFLLLSINCSSHRSIVCTALVSGSLRQKLRVKIKETNKQHTSPAPVVSQRVDEAGVDDPEAVGQTLEALHGVLVREVVPGEDDADVLAPVDAECAAEDVDGRVSLCQS